MTQTVKYELTWDETQTVNLPNESTVITGMIKDTKLCIWVKEDSSANRVAKHFKFFDNKDDGYANDLHYVCTVAIPDSHGGGQGSLFMQK
jgi:hypothetical protein